MADDELAELTRLLQAEFPDLDPSEIQRALLDNDLDVAAARRALYALPASRAAPGDAHGAGDAQYSRASQQYEAPSPPDRQAADPLISWLSGSGGGGGGGGAGPPPASGSPSWDLGLDEVTAGLSNLGAQLSLGFRQVAEAAPVLQHPRGCPSCAQHSLGQLLPAELNPFVEEYEYEEGEEEEEARRRAAADEEGVRAASAHKASEALHKRGRGGGAGGGPLPSPGQRTSTAEEEEEGEDDWEENQKWE